MQLGHRHGIATISIYSRYLFVMIAHALQRFHFNHSYVEP